MVSFASSEVLRNAPFLGVPDCILHLQISKKEVLGGDFCLFVYLGVFVLLCFSGSVIVWGEGGRRFFCCGFFC